MSKLSQQMVAALLSCAVEWMPDYKTGAHPSTLIALRKRGLIEMKLAPNQGWDVRFTPLGFAEYAEYQG